MAGTLTFGKRTAAALGATLLMATALFVPPVYALDVRAVRSELGIDAWLAEDHTLPVVSLHFAFLGAGSAAEPESRGGLATVAAKLLTEGAGPYDDEAYGTRLATHGIELEFSADRDALNGALETTSEHLDTAFELLALALTEPRLERAALERVRASQLASIVRLQTDPNYVASTAWWSRAFAGHTYARPVFGTAESLHAFNVDDVRNFLRHALSRGRLVIAAAGAIDAQRLGVLLDRAFGTLPVHPAYIPPARIEPRLAGDIAVARLPLPQSTVAFGQRGIERTAPDYYPALVLEHILGGGALTSRLFLELREKRGLVYTAKTMLEHHAGANLLTGWFATKNATVNEAIEIVRTQWRRLARGDVTAAEVEAAKAYLAGSLVLRLDGTDAVATVLLTMARLGLGLEHLNERAAMLRAVTVDRVRRAGHERLDPARLTFSVAGAPSTN